MRILFPTLIALLLMAVPGPARSETKPPKRSATLAVGLSMVFPGGGQIYTQNYLKAGAFGAALGYFGYRFYREDRAMKDAYDLHARDGSPAQYNVYLDRYERRRNAMWWGIGTWVVSMVDAYVDAHLFKFSDQAEPNLSLEMRPGRVALTKRF